VATAVNGTTELIRGGEDGLLFEPGDVAGLAACVSKVLAEPGLAAKLRVRGPERIASLGLTWPAHGRRLLAIYRDVLGK
jgi:glycogen(starch) synthase